MRHYLKMLESHARKSLVPQIQELRSGWEQSVFDDLTQEGSCLTFVIHANGATLSLIGKNYYCEAKLDQSRADQLLITNYALIIERPANPDAKLYEYSAEFVLITQAKNRGSVPVLDSCRNLIQDAKLKPFTTEALLPPPALPAEDPMPPGPPVDRATQAAAAPAEPSPPVEAALPSPASGHTLLFANAHLAQLAAQATEKLRRSWQPVADGREATSPQDLLTSWKNVWARYGLGPYIQRPMSKRVSGFMSYGIVPSELRNEERHELLASFDMKMINAFTADHLGQPDIVLDLLLDLAAFPLLPAVRASIWSEMLKRLQPNQFRRELHDAADVLLDLASDEQLAKLWAMVLLRACEAVASESGDVGLAERVDEVRDAKNPLLALMEWAKSLSYHSEQTPEDADAGSGESSPGLLIAQSSEVEALLAGASAPASKLAATELQAGASVLETWVLLQRHPDLGQLAKDCAEIRKELMKASAAALADKPSQILTLLSVLDELPATIELWKRCLPRADLLRTDLENAQAAYERACRRFNPMYVEQFLAARFEGAHSREHDLLRDELGALTGQSISPESLQQILNLLDDASLLRELPSWIWSRDLLPDPALEAGDERAWFERLQHPSIRQRVLLVSAMQKKFNIAPLSLLSELAPPATLGIEEFSSHIELFFIDLRERRSVLQKVAEPFRGWVQRDVQTADLKRVLDYVEVLQAQQEHVSPSVFVEICTNIAKCSDPDQREAEIAYFARAINKLEGTLRRSVLDAPFSMITSMADVERKRTQEDPPKSAAPLFEYSHLQVDHPHRRAPLVFRPHPELPYGFVSAPIMVESEVRRAVEMQIELRTGERIKSWPPEWDSHTPREMSIRLSDWRAHWDRSTWIYTFELVLPIRRPGKPNERIEITLTAKDRKTGVPISNPRKLEWEEVELSASPIRLQWLLGVHPEYVQLHPMGPQTDKEHIETAIQNGESFTVIAPRRFGKTNLMEYLRGRAAEMNIVVPRPISCEIPIHGKMLNYADLWKSVSERLQTEVGASLDPVTSELPEEDAFDRVRRKAHKLGKKSIAIFLDEAQLFFPENGGRALGSSLKNLLERTWARTDSPDMVPVLFGFFGLPSLRERCGVNLLGYLRTFERTTVEEAELERVIRTVTGGALNTTKDARQILIAGAGSFHVLRQLVERLVERIPWESRHWAFYNDAVEVKDATKVSLRDGSAPQLGEYLRDAINDHELVTEWKPHPCFPVALALAKGQLEGIASHSELVNRAVILLNDWCRDLLNDERMVRLTFSRERVDEHIRSLGDLGLFKKGNFSSELFAAWLMGIIREGFPNDPAARDSLLRGAIRRIKEPQGGEPIGRGTEGAVYRFQDNGSYWSYRLVPLDEASRDRFLENVEALQVLKQGVHQREDAAPYIFDLRDMGLSADNDWVGVQIYRWIEGADLSSEKGHLSVSFIADLGWRLASAVCLLHRLGVLHRDIRPENIILSHVTSKPVLVDFGMARLGQAKMDTIIDHDFAPREVRGREPKWSKAADVYSLAMTLTALIDEKDRNAALLRDCVSPCLADLPEERPSAEQFAASLNALVTQLDVVRVREDALVRISQAAGKGRNEKWFSGILDKNREHFGAFALGGHATALARAVRIADLLNQILEAFSLDRKQKYAKRLTLGYVKHANQDTGTRLSTSEMNFLHDLRLYGAHGDKLAAPFRSRYGLLDTQVVRERVANGAQQIAAVVEQPTLVTVIDILLKLGTDLEVP